MSEYVLVLVWLAFMALFSHYVNVSKTEYVLGKKREVYTWWFGLLVFAPLIYFATFRGNFGDTSMYQNTFHKMPDTIEGIIKEFPKLDKDRGFYTLEMLIKTYITHDCRVFFFILALVQVLFLIKIYRRYSINFVLTVFIFVASTDYLAWMQNGTKQFLAATICMQAFELMLRKKYFFACVTIVIASFIHQSALVMLPIVFFSLGEPWNYRSILLIVVTLVIVMNIGAFTELLDNALEETQYTNVVSDWKSTNDDGTNPLRVLVYCMPTILSYIGFRYIKEENDPIINYMVNFSISTAAVYIISMFTSGIYIGRLPIYTSIFTSELLLPWEIEHIFSKESARLIQLMLIVFYLLLYYLQINSWGHW